MKKTAVYKWVKWFSEGSESVTDEKRAGRPATIRTEENITLKKTGVELPVTSEEEKLVQVLVWDVTNTRISLYEIVLTPITRRLFANLSQKRIWIDLRPTVTSEGPSDNGTGISISSSSCPSHCHSNIAPSAINSHLRCNVWMYIPVEVWDTPILAIARLLRFWVRILPAVWRFFCYECCVLSGRGLCVTRPGEFYRLWCVVMCDLDTSRTGKECPALGHRVTGEKLDAPLHNFLSKRSITQCYYFWTVESNVIKT
jgi:hypothetical protein